ncbi:ethanolamine ammonia-lyase [Paenibacillus pectinilyticus]|uniref:Ethanolamine ammonia-lyase small subunit n=1 Tax=Paenibacillus pectinilyticus TaxID=512399 RepID=A0A1C1A809_9BACL|nr:ethanolamine ammonia-lyase subunit EutC [Paenibacillus pectinilyticus]OCT16744.1 ethanolamine ammonia-lyase [Paenibacillus pectinilyticus]
MDELDRMKATTPARIGVSRSGTRPLTHELLKLRWDHASAVDAVQQEVSEAFLAEMGWFVVESCATDKDMYLKRPYLGRALTQASKEEIKANCQPSPQVQIVISDGLSASSIEANLRDLYPALRDSLRLRGLTAGTTFYVNRGRVGCMDAIGDLLNPECLVLLIGERPGLMTAESLSAYMCYKPRTGRTDADRLVISNIHRGGTPPMEAGAHIGGVLEQILMQRTSGVDFM